MAFSWLTDFPLLCPADGFESMRDHVVIFSDIKKTSF